MTEELKEFASMFYYVGAYYEDAWEQFLHDLPDLSWRFPNICAQIMNNKEV